MRRCKTQAHAMGSSRCLRHSGLSTELHRGQERQHAVLRRQIGIAKQLNSDELQHGDECAVVQRRAECAHTRAMRVSLLTSSLSPQGTRGEFNNSPSSQLTYCCVLLLLIRRKFCKVTTRITNSTSTSLPGRAIPQSFSHIIYSIAHCRRVD